MQWWFCLIHLAVESGPGCPDESRLGPFDTQEQAQTVLDRMKQRNEDFDQEEDR